MKLKIKNILIDTQILKMEDLEIGETHRMIGEFIIQATTIIKEKEIAEDGWEEHLTS